MFFKTLEKTVDKELKKSIYKNEYFLENKWTLSEKFITMCSKRPILSTTIFLIIFAILFFILQQFITTKYIYDDIKGFKDLILNGQLTVLALIFPLVIGFVGFIIKNDIANKALWKIYSTYSGFMFIGLNGLYLVIATIIFLNFIVPLIDDKSKIALILTFSIWFIFNLVLVGWLLVSTFRFIHIKKQHIILTKYTINYILLTEIKKRLFTLLPLHANKFDLLKKYDGRTKSEIIFNYSDYIHSNTDKVSIIFEKAKYLRNINYTLLSWCICIWRFRNNYFLTRKNIKLHLPVTSNGFPYKRYDLALLSQHNFTGLEIFLIKSSYSFSTTSPFDEDDNIMDIVLAMFNNIENSMQNSNNSAFSNAIETMQQLMKLIINITNFEEDGNIDNWLLLSDNSFFSRKLLDELIQEYYSLNSLVIEKTLETDYYFKEYCSIYPHLLNNDNTHPDIQKAIMRTHYYLWFYLIKNQKLQTTPYYNSLFIKYIGGWESWSYKRIRNINNWINAKNSANILNEHLMLSCKHVIVSIKHKNSIATKWAINLLNNWNKNYDLARSYSPFKMNTSIINSSIFLHNENSSLVKFIIGNSSEENKIKSLHDNALMNNYIHARVLTTAYILNNNIDSITDREIEAIYALINGQKTSPDSHVKKIFNFNIFEKILEAYILNLSCVWNITENGLGFILIRDFYGIDEPEHISGRVYGGLVNDNVNSLKQSFITLLICHSTRSFKISDDIYKLIISTIFPTQNKMDLKSSLEELTNIDEDSKEKVKKILDKNDVTDLVERYTESMRDIISQIDNDTQQIISNSLISEDRLNKIKKYCSEKAFKQDTAGIPLVLFDNVEYVNTLNEECKKTISLHNVDKKSLIDDEINRSINEDDFYAGLVEEQVNIYIYRAIFNDILYVEKEFDNEPELIVNMLKDSSVSSNMIILIGEYEISSFIHSLSWNKDIEVPFKVTRKDGYANGYLCHINNIPAYQIENFNIDFCLLVNKNIFESVKIKEDNGIFVNLKYELDTKELNQGILNISYYMDVILNKESINYKYIYKSDNESD